MRWPIIAVMTLEIQTLLFTLLLVGAAACSAMVLI
jgi:hypothetical protein